MAMTPPTLSRPAAWQELLPPVQRVLEGIWRKPRPPMESLSAPAARALYAQGAHVLEVAAPALPRVQELRIPARDGHPLPARLYAPQAEAAAANPLPVLVFFHGGGFVVGSVATHDTLCRVLCQRSGCAVVSVDYRLAPEWKFPTAHSDAWDAVCWVQHNAIALGLDAARMAVGGDSAGGTLAAACAVQAIQPDSALLHPLRLQLLFYPGMVAQPVHASRQTYGQGFLLTEAHIQWMFHSYARTPADFADWRFAPVLADSVDGIAPLWLGLAECDPLVDDSLQWADKLRAAGVPVALEIYRGVIHEFIKMGRTIAQAHQAHADAAAALRQALWG